MKIILGKNAGFCYGVKNAVNGAKNAVKNNEIVYCLGDIVHNKTVIKNLEQSGLIFTNNIDEVKNKVLIRAHGETNEVYEKLIKKGIAILDFTCPNVIKTHEYVEEYSQKGYFIILVGIKNHPEAIGTLSYSKDNSYLLQEKDQYEELINQIEKSQKKDILIIAQTTYNSKKFDEIVIELRNLLSDKNIKVIKTICKATEIRQEETSEIAKKVDLMIIIGDKKSSNTNKLNDIAKKNCNKTIFVQNPDELNIEDLQGVNTIGIMAGASTPEEDINDVINKIKKYERNENKND